MTEREVPCQAPRPTTDGNATVGYREPNIGPRGRNGSRPSGGAIPGASALFAMVAPALAAPTGS
eukprot:8838265-Lingulodinium_polyedra.AAC.1